MELHRKKGRLREIVTAAIIVLMHLRLYGFASPPFDEFALGVCIRLFTTIT